jgi:hypothetical protein
METGGRVTGWACENVAQNVAQHKFIHNWFSGKSSPKICATSVILKTLPIVNNPPIGENSPNQVTLTGGSSKCLIVDNNKYVATLVKFNRFLKRLLKLNSRQTYIGSMLFMITIFCDFRTFSAKKLCVFSQKHIYTSTNTFVHTYVPEQGGTTHPTITAYLYYIADVGINVVCLN